MLEHNSYLQSVADNIDNLEKDTVDIAENKLVIDTVSGLDSKDNIEPDQSLKQLQKFQKWMHSMQLN